MYPRLLNLPYLLTIKRLVLVLSLGLCINYASQAQSSDQLKDQRMAVIERMEATSLIVDQTQEQIYLIDQEIKALKAQREEAPADQEQPVIETLEGENAIEILEQERDSISEMYHLLVEEIGVYYLKAQHYKSTQKDTVARRAAKRYYLKNYQQSLKNKLNEIDRKMNLLIDENEDEVQKNQSIASENQSRMAVAASLEEMIENTANYRQELISSIATTRSTLKSLQAEREVYNVKIEQAIIAELSGKNLRSTAPEYEVYRGKSIATLKGKLNYPLAGAKVTRAFGKQNHPSLSNIKVMNNGLDLSSTTSGEVVALYDGKVISIMSIPGVDQLVIVQHGEYYTVYSKVDNVSVSIDQKVSAGELIGTLNAERGAYELHIEIWKGKQKLDPAKWLRG